MESRFIQQSNDRRVPPEHTGDVLLWDIDKTYLCTHFSNLRGLVRIPFEWAVDKETVPGVVPLLRALRRGPGRESAMVPLYFVSGSPPQLRRVIERKMVLDGVEFDGVTFEDHLALTLVGRLGEIRAQVGYKLSALLMLARALPLRASWLLFGDDVEQDAETFLLFGEVIAGLRGDRLLARLRRRHGVGRRSARAVVEAADRLGTGPDPVVRVFIHCSRGGFVSRRRARAEGAADPRVAATLSYLQSAGVLAHMGRVPPETVATVAQDLRRRGMTESVLREHLDDAGERLGVPEAILDRARSAGSGRG